MNKKIFVLIFLYLFIFNNLTLIMISHPSNSIQISESLALIDTNSVNNSIIINGDTQLAALASLGNGSSINPYIIENYSISNCALGVDGIKIQNTNKYFVLRNITIFHCFNGFYFSNVIFGSIINSFAFNNSNYDIYLDTSFNNTLVNNTTTNGYFELISSSNNTLVNNTAVGTIKVNTNGFAVGSGFSLINSSYNVLINNTATGGGSSEFSLINSSNNILKNNTGQYNGIYDYIVSASNKTSLINNTFTKSYPTATTSSMLSFSFIEIVGVLALLILFKRRK